MGSGFLLNFGHESFQVNRKTLLTKKVIPIEVKEVEFE